MKYQMLILLYSVMFFGCKSDPEPSLNVENETAVAQNNIEADNDIKQKIEEIELEIVDFDGLRKYLEREDEKTYIVNFWATWCAPCIKELPHFEKLNDETSDDKVEVILVSLDFPTKYETNLKPYIVKHSLKSKIVALDDADSNSWIPKISEQWSGAIPATLIYNKSKRKFHEGSFNYEELQNAVKPFIK